MATRTMKGEKAHQVSLPRARDDCPLLAGHAAAVSCFSSPFLARSQPHCSLTTDTSGWLCSLSSQEEAPEQKSTRLSPAIALAERAVQADDTAALVDSWLFLASEKLSLKDQRRGVVG